MRTWLMITTTCVVLLALGWAILPRTDESPPPKRPSEELGRSIEIEATGGARASGASRVGSHGTDIHGDDDSRYGGELIYAYGVEPRTLFPGFELASNAQEIWLNVCENLVEINEKNEIVPWLASSWDFSNDDKVCTVELQKGVRFTDGTSLNAEAVKFVFDEIRARKFVATYLLEGINEIEAVDEHTVRFRFDAPLAAFLPNLAYRSLCIWNHRAYLEHGAEWMNTHPTGTGPFLLDEWRHGEFIRFVRNPRYWKPGLPYLDGLTIVIVPEASVRTMMLETGEADRAVQLSDFDLQWLDADPHITVRTVPSTRQYYVVLNNLAPGLKDPLVRRALNYGVDKVGMVASVFAGVGASPPRAPILSEGVVGFVDMTEGEESLYPYSKQRARALLEQAGYSDKDGDGVVEDRDGSPLKLSLITAKGRSKGDDQIAELVHIMLRDIGVDVSLRFWEWATYASMLSLPPERAEYELALLSWGIPTADADEPMMLLFYSRSWRPIGSNRMFYANERVDQLALAAHHAVDPERRIELVAEWARLIIEDAPVIFLPTLSLNLATKTYVHGDQILPVENYPTRFAWLDKREMARQGIKR